MIGFYSEHDVFDANSFILKCKPEVVLFAMETGQQPSFHNELKLVGVHFLPDLPLSTLLGDDGRSW